MLQLRKIALTIISLGLLQTAFAQADINEINDLRTKKGSADFKDTVAWVHGGNFALGVNQGLLHNWSAGGELASLGINGMFNGSLTRYNKRRVWANNLDAAYGLFYAYSNDFEPRKTDDRIDLTSKYGYRLKEKSNLFFTSLLNAKTQFTKAYDYDIPNWKENPTSGLLSPIYLTLAPGIEYSNVYKNSKYSLFFSPIAARGTFVSKKYTNLYPEGAFGVRNGKNFRMELGAYFTGRYETNITKDITYRTRLDLYSNYLAKNDVVNGVVVKRDNPGNIDILWDNNFSFNFFKYFSLNFGVLAIYDNDVPYQSTYVENGVIMKKDEPLSGLGWWQIKQAMTVGFAYKF